MSTAIQSGGRRLTARAAPVALFRRFVGVGPPGDRYRVHDPMLPTCDESEKSQMFRHTADPKTISVIGAPMTFGQPFVGTDHGPRLLREAGLIHGLSTLGWRVHDTGNLDFDELVLRDGFSARYDAPKARHSRIVGRGCQILADVVEKETSKGRFPLILGGDHSVALGTLAGILRARPNTGVIWVDAHADLNTPDISESGNMHGMPVGLLMQGLATGHERMPGLEWLAESEKGSGEGDLRDPPRLSPDSIVYVGLRDVDRAERFAIRNLGILAYTMHDVDRYGIGQIMDMALNYLLKDEPDRPLHLSYDIDAIDPLHAPATGTAVRGGLTYREAHYIAEAVARSGSLASAEMVELNPTLSDGEGSKETVELGLGVLTSLLGKSII